MDEIGREVLSFIPGDVPHSMPEWIRTEQVLIDVARSLREWHDATADFSAPDAKWGLPPTWPLEVICHNDFAPYNCIFREGRFIGAIDFDMCAPGSRLWDLAYTAYRFVPLMPGPDTGDDANSGDKSPFEAPMMAARLECFLACYGAVEGTARYGSGDLIRVTIERLHALAAWTEEFVRSNRVVALADHPAIYRSHARWLQTWSESSEPSPLTGTR
ncbi:MAG: phosphotransferase [Fibrobacteria bacterium]